MKKILMILIIGIIACTGCNKKPEVYILNATVLEVNEKGVLVEPVEGSLELNSSDKIWIYLTNDDRNMKEYYTVGLNVSIGYDGRIMETYPAQIHAEYIEILE